jgi:large subunit ribosomal protein L10
MADAEAERTTDDIPDWKRQEVGALTELIRNYQSVGVVDVRGIPSRQLQTMRRDLHGTAELRMGRNSLIQLGLEEVDDGVEVLIEEVSGQVGLVGTDANPFTLYQDLEASKTPAPINAGEIAPNDIVIEAGDTGMDPGPFVGELQQVGADARIQDGSIRVLSDSVVAEAGDEVDATLANVLAELEIEPKEVGLDLRAVYSDGVRFAAEELELDVETYRSDVVSAAASARTLAIETAYPTTSTLPALLSKARGNAIAVGLEGPVEDPGLMDDLVARADDQVRALAAAVDDPEALPEELQEPELKPPEDTSESQQDTDEQADEEEDAEPDAATEDDGEDTDEDGDGADALGDMFG